MNASLVSCPSFPVESRFWRAEAQPKEGESGLSAPATTPCSIDQPVVSSQDLLKPVMWQRLGAVPVSSDHSLRRDHRVDDRLLGRLDSRDKETADFKIADETDVGCRTSPCRTGVGGRESDEDVTRTVRGYSTRAGNAQRRATGNSLELVRKQGGKSGDILLEG